MCTMEAEEADSAAPSVYETTTTPGCGIYEARI